MQATGITRRIDDLGRIVLPREIRRTLNIKENSPMEIFLTSDKKGLVLIPYRYGIKEELEALENKMKQDISFEDERKVHSALTTIFNILEENGLE